MWTWPDCRRRNCRRKGENTFLKLHSGGGMLQRSTGNSCKDTVAKASRRTETDKHAHSGGVRSSEAEWEASVFLPHRQASKGEGRLDVRRKRTSRLQHHLVSSTAAADAARLDVMSYSIITLPQISKFWLLGAVMKRVSEELFIEFIETIHG